MVNGCTCNGVGLEVMVCFVVNMVSLIIIQSALYGTVILPAMGFVHIRNV